MQLHTLNLPQICSSVSCSTWNDGVVALSRDDMDAWCSLKMGFLGLWILPSKPILTERGKREVSFHDKGTWWWSLLLWLVPIWPVWSFSKEGFNIVSKYFLQLRLFRWCSVSVFAVETALSSKAPYTNKVYAYLLIKSTVTLFWHLNQMHNICPPPFLTFTFSIPMWLWPVSVIDWQENPMSSVFTYQALHVVKQSYHNKT